MARLTLTWLVLLGPMAAPAQQDLQFKEAGVCARCHVISVVEWGMSRHRTANTDCIACHGASAGHVDDERNNIKPERMPQGEAIAALCAGCHTAGCPKTRQKAACQTCHHFHALVDPKAPPAVPDQSLARSRPAPATRSPKPPPRITVAGVTLVLIPGGEFDMGSERFPTSRPVHTVRVEPFYLAATEVTQAQWTAIMGSNPNAHKGDQFPVEKVSFEDAQAFLARLNSKVPGGGFRLPAEAEWEFAAADAQPVAGGTAPQPAGSGPPNKFGLHEMLGNVWEWCSGSYLPYPSQSGDSALGVLRGGGFVDPPDLLHAAFRHSERPTRRLRYNGLRLARSADPR